MASNEEPSLQQLWKEAQKRFFALTGKSLSNTAHKSLDDITKEIERSADADTSNDDDDRKTKTKQACMNVLYCLKLLGGVAAQGAAIVYGPAENCFNAASLLLDMPKKVHDFHELVNSIFEKVSVFLGQFRIYQRIEKLSKIDPLLLQTVHELMICFVDLCALSINLRNGDFWKRFRKSAKMVLMDDDSGVKHGLDKFQDLIQKQSVVRETLTLEEVLKSENELAQLLYKSAETNKKIDDLHRGMDILTTAEKDRTVGRMSQDRLQKVEKKLGVKKETLDSARKRSDDNWADSTEKTGNWLYENSLYKEWCDAESGFTSVLLLSGNANSGKSYLISAVIRGLQSARGGAYLNSSRTNVVSYYYLRSADKGQQKGALEPHAIENALKSMFWQMAEQDTSYAKYLASICEANEEDYFKSLTCWELLNKLLASAPERDVTYYMVIDGLDQVPERRAQELLEALSKLRRSAGSERTQIRVLISGTPDVFDSKVFFSVPTIEIEKENGPDVRTYIENKLKTDDLLQESDSATTELQEYILDNLPDAVQGNFAKADSAINRISSAISADLTSEDVKKVVDQAGQNRETFAQNVKEDLSDALSGREIEELNELLNWTILGYAYLSAEIMQAISYCHFKATSLQPMSKKIAGKYSRLLEIDGENVVIKSDLEDSLVVEESRRHAEEEAPRISATITITKADQKTVQNFLWALTEKAMIDKFTFDNPVAAITTKPSIGISRFDGHLDILDKSLTALQAEADDNLRLAMPYMTMYIPDHLNALLTNESGDTLTQAEKSRLGRMVYDLFVDEDVLMQHYWDVIWADVAKSWLTVEYGVAGISAFWDLLDQKDATSQLGKKDKQWLADMTAEENRNQALLRPLTVSLAEQWLQNADAPKWFIESTFNWISKWLDIKTVYEEEAADDEDAEKQTENGENAEAEEGSLGQAEDKPADDSNSEQAQSVQGSTEDGKTETPEHTDEEDNDTEGEKESTHENNKSSSSASEKDNKSSENKSDADKDAASQTNAGDETELTDVQMVARAEEWAAGALDGETRNSLWYEHLGITYLSVEASEEAMTAFKSAQGLDEKNWRATEGLALAYEKSKNYEAAVAEMKKAVEGMHEDDDLDEDDRKQKMFDDLLSLAEWQAQLKVMTDAMKCYEEALQLDLDNSKAQFKMLRLMLTNGQDQEAQDFIQGLLEKTVPDSDLGQLSALMPHFVEEESNDFIFDLLFAATHKTPMFPQVLAQMQAALEAAEKEQRTDDQAMLLYYSGIARYHYDQSDTRNPAAARDLWDECSSMKNLGSSPSMVEWAAKESMRHLGVFHYQRAITGPNSASHVEKLEQLASDHRKYQFQGDHSRASLAYYHAHISRDTAKAKSVLIDDVKEAVDLLSDEEDWNDWQGLYQLANVFLHFCDEDNALGAWLMLGPASKEDQSSDSAYFHCDGRCGTKWISASNIYCCRICPDVQLCEDCHGKIVAGNMKWFVCSSTHDWLHIPEQPAPTISNGTSDAKPSANLVPKGDQFVPMEDWLNAIRDEWGIPRPEKKEETDGEHSDPGSEASHSTS